LSVKKKKKNTLLMISFFVHLSRKIFIFDRYSLSDIKI